MSRKIIFNIFVTITSLALLLIADFVSGSEHESIADTPNESSINSSQQIYTIQTGSFLLLEGAQEQFDSILKILNEKEFGFLRVEQIGKYYAVRVGKFADYNEAEQFIVEAQPDFPHADILEVYIKEDRIINYILCFCPGINEDLS